MISKMLTCDVGLDFWHFLSMSWYHCYCETHGIIPIFLNGSVLNWKNWIDVERSSQKHIISDSANNYSDICRLRTLCKRKCAHCQHNLEDLVTNTEYFWKFINHKKNLTHFLGICTMKHKKVNQMKRLIVKYFSSIHNGSLCHIQDDKNQIFKYIYHKLLLNFRTFRKCWVQDQKEFPIHLRNAFTQFPNHCCTFLTYL